MQNQFDENSFTPRTLQSHIRQCREIERASTDSLKNALMTTHGIKRRSKLLDFPGYDLIQQTPQDIMHIMLEGVVQQEIKCALKHIILSGHIDLDSINSVTQGFPYSNRDIKDKPCPISVSTMASDDNKLKQSSGQMLIFLKIFPFIMNSIKDNVYVQFIIELIQITHILFAPIVMTETLQKLRVLIEQHLKQFRQLFPDNNITPKQHYMLHLPSQIEALGPLTRHMCMRFESKHCFFKQWSSKLNYKNVCKSLVNHSKIVESTYQTNNIFAHEKELGPTSAVSEASEAYVGSKIRDFLNIDSFHHVISVKWMSLNGNKYISGKTLIITDSNDGLPIFGLISNIYVIDSSLFCCEYQVFDTLKWDTDLQSYEIAVPNAAQATEFIDLEKLPDYTAYHPVPFNSKTYVLRKYDLTDVLLYEKV